MLTHLHLIDFALAENLSLDIESGFNVITGETGAGKSLLLDALSICLGERTDTSYVRYHADRADVSAIFSYDPDSQEALWLQHRELEDDSGEIHLRRVIFANGRSKAWINGRPSSLSELKQLGRLLVQLYSQHSQQELLDIPYPRQWLDRYGQLQTQASQVTAAYQEWITAKKTYQDALQAQASRSEQIFDLEQKLVDLEQVDGLDYSELEQAFDRQSHHEAMMQEGAQALVVLDEDDQNIYQQVSSLVRRLEEHRGRDSHLELAYQSLVNTESELSDAIAELHQFVDQQSFDPEHYEKLNQQLSIFHRLARKYRIQPETLAAHQTEWQSMLEKLQVLDDPAALAEAADLAEQNFLTLAQDLDQTRQKIAIPLAEALSKQVRPMSLPEAHFEFEFKTLEQPNSDGLSLIQLLFTANKGIPAKPLARVASGGELSRIALVMQVMTAEKTASELLVFDEIDVGISGGTAEIVGRLLSDLAEHVQILCITHQAQVAAQSDHHWEVEKQQTDPASSLMRHLTEDERITELARMTGGVEISQATLEHAKALRQLKFDPHSSMR